jgi:Ca-activated chloride channel family protein
VNELHFLRPWWFLALIPALVILFVMLRGRASDSAWRAVLDRSLLERLWLEPPGVVSRLPLLLLGSGWLLAALALAGPVWERQPEPVWRSQAPLVLVLDLSASMDAADPAPSRLRRARYKILDILQQTREGRVALVVFAGESHVVAPLTDDGDTIANLLGALSTDIVPAPGDAAAPALRLAGKLLEQAGATRGDVLLLSDGLSDTAAALGAARSLHDRNQRLSVLALGTVGGAPVPGSDGGSSSMSKLNPEPLRALSRAGGGAFSLMTVDDRDLNRVLPDAHGRASLQSVEEPGVSRWVEQGVWLLPPLLLLGAAGFRRGWLMGALLVVVLPPPVHALQWRDLWLRTDQQAADALQQGQAQTAARQFTDPAWQGMALYQARDYAAAAEAFAESDAAEADYNRGNALARAGRLAEAAQTYRDVLAQNPGHADARANLELVERLLQQQQDQPQQSGQGDGSQQQRDQSQQSGQGDGSQQQQTGAGGDAEEQQDAGPSADESGMQEDSSATQGQAPVGEQVAGKPRENAPDQPDGVAGGAGKERQSEQEDPAASARRDMMQQMQAQGQAIVDEPMANGPAEVPVRTGDTESLNETELALEQWLRRIPEDPGGLLRRKFMLEHLQRKRERE